MNHCVALINVARTDLLDFRQSAIGYDFGTTRNSLLAIEVKGLKGDGGSILFTDHEWSTARLRGDHYVVVVVGNIDKLPGRRMLLPAIDLCNMAFDHLISIASAAGLHVDWRTFFQRLR